MEGSRQTWWWSSSSDLYILSTIHRQQGERKTLGLAWASVISEPTPVTYSLVTKHSSIWVYGELFLFQPPQSLSQKVPISFEANQSPSSGSPMPMAILSTDHSHNYTHKERSSSLERLLGSMRTKWLPHPGHPECTHGRRGDKDLVRLSGQPPRFTPGRGN